MLTANFKFLSELEILKKPTLSRKILNLIKILENQISNQKINESKVQCFAITKKVLQITTNSSSSNFGSLEKKFIAKYQPPLMVKAALYQIEAVWANHHEPLKTEDLLLKEYKLSDLYELISHFHLFIKYIWLLNHPQRSDVLGSFERKFYLPQVSSQNQSQLAKNPPIADFFNNNLQFHFHNYSKSFAMINSKYLENELSKFASIYYLKIRKYYGHFVLVNSPTKNSCWVNQGQEKILTLLLLVTQLQQLCKEKRLPESVELANYNSWIKKSFLQHLPQKSFQRKELITFFNIDAEETQSTVIGKYSQIRKLVRKWWLQIGPKEWLKALTIILNNFNYSQIITSPQENEIPSSGDSNANQKEILTFLFYQKTPFKILFENEQWLVDELEKNIFNTKNYFCNFLKLINIWWKIRNPKIFSGKIHYADQFTKLWPSKEIITARDFKREILNFLRMWKLYSLLTGDDYQNKVKYLKPYLLDLVNLQSAGEASYPLILSVMFRFLDYNANNLWPETKVNQELEKIIHLLQVYLIRLFVVQKRSPNVGKIFDNLIGLNDFSVINDQIFTASNTSKCPALEDFDRNLKNENKIHMDARKPMLRTIVYHITPEEKRTARWWKQLTQLTVEHIMPRNPINWEDWCSNTKLLNNEIEWRKDHEKHLNLIGNLLLLSDEHNKTINNQNFSEKIRFYKEHKIPLISQKAGIQLMDISKVKEFTFAKIKRRSQHLLKIIVELYKLPEEDVSQLD